MISSAFILRKNAFMFLLNAIQLKNAAFPVSGEHGDRKNLEIIKQEVALAKRLSLL